MPRFFQILVVLWMALVSRPVEGFSLLGPIGAEAWQIQGLGYNPFNNEIGTPRNLGEEYRWNVPVITYGYDNSFLNYFGSNGVAAVEAAFGILNSLPNLATLDQNLTNYPLSDGYGGATTFRDSRRRNGRAGAANIVDLKTVTLGLLVEEMGLASPERWTFALRDRKTETDPTVTNYLVIHRNFDPVTYEPSKYVNGNRYTYEVIEVDVPAYADASERAVDPLHAFSSVASLTGGLENRNISPGIFFTFLTRDDIGGLRYLYDTNNLNWEPFPVGTQIIGVDRTTLTVIPNIDLALFSSLSLTSSPAALLNLYPGLVFTSTNLAPTTIVDIASIYITNLPPQPWEDPFVTNLALRTNYVTNAAIASYYTFGNVITNYSSPFSMVRREVFGLEREPWSTAQNPIFRTNVSETLEPRPSGAIIIVPSGGATIDPFDTNQFEFTGFGVTNIIPTTNLLFQSVIVEGGVARLVTDVEITYFTNVQYFAYPFLAQAAPVSLLRPGIGKLEFRRIGSTTFNGPTIPYTNRYSAAYIQDGVMRTNIFINIQTLPDILIRAEDLGVFNDNVYPVQIGRTPGFQNNAALNSDAALGGPGTIFGTVRLTFNKVGPSIVNMFPVFTTEATLQEFPRPQPFVWGSFDGSTNAPIVYPKDISLEQIELLITGGGVP